MFLAAPATTDKKWLGVLVISVGFLVLAIGIALIPWLALWAKFVVASIVIVLIGLFILGTYISPQKDSHYEV